MTTESQQPARVIQARRSSVALGNVAYPKRARDRFGELLIGDSTLGQALSVWATEHGKVRDWIYEETLPPNGSPALTNPPEQLRERPL